MKIQLTFLILTITLLFSCTGNFHTTINENIKTTENCSDTDATETVEYTNTSRSKYLQVTIKRQNEDGTSHSTYIIEIKPGEIQVDCESPEYKLTIVGEREITGEKDF